jgi:hypothetical protein
MIFPFLSPGNRAQPDGLTLKVNGNEMEKINYPEWNII